jgi:exopolyphosphatase/guanosine-5'-triphosphate,3'-diphosphate pyrophosphatase
VRVAVVDLGTNTVLLLVAERGPAGTTRALVECATITRLGEGVDRSRRLAPQAVLRTCECLGEYARLVRESHATAICVVGTSATRDAVGGEEIRACVRSAFGVDLRVLTGIEEARLTFRGALSGLSVEPGEEVAVFDVGGGSTEVVVGLNEPSGPILGFAESFDIGSVRLTERHVLHDPPTPTELDALARSAAEAFALVPPIPHGRPPIGVAGTLTTLAAVALGVSPYEGARVHGQTIRTADLKTVIRDLSRVDLQTRRSVVGMEVKRADVIVAGGVIALALLERWQASSVVVSDRGVRWGLAQDLLWETAVPSADEASDGRVADR